MRQIALSDDSGLGMFLDLICLMTLVWACLTKCQHKFTKSGADPIVNWFKFGSEGSKLQALF